MEVPVIAPKATLDPWAEYDILPDDQRAEVLNGRLVCMAPPTGAHNFAAGAVHAWCLFLFTRGMLGGPGGWWFLENSGLVLGNPKRPHRLQPDIMGWRKERAPNPPASVWSTLPPDWVCEILSESTEVLDRGERMEIFAKAGVKHVWLVDVVAQLLEVFENDAGVLRPIARHQSAALVRARPFDACELQLSDLWIPVATSAP
jgi:Uma2 family endonuclease